MRLTDMSWANKIRDGDVQAYERLINENKNQVFNYCLRMTNHYDTSEDLAQEVFLKFYTSIDLYDWTKSSLKTWILVITRNLCLNFLRDRKRDPQAGLYDDNVAVFSSPEDQLLLQDDLRRLSTVLASLPEQDRELVIMKDYLGLKYRETAQVLGIPAGTVKSRLHNIHIKLRKVLGEGYES